MKSEFNRSISGVCGGIANYFELSALFVRVIFLIFIPANLIIYMILANIIPDPPSSLYKK
ncbi:PspC domain-containing protein [Paenibacillus sp. YAF4_2]|uniref:PspC domain-containing protein n=1 Tax=Paenibacillus sp. YAF4_2 TaxID=3233085 RepID=UPI003F9EA7D7